MYNLSIKRTQINKNQKAVGKNKLKTRHLE